MRRILFWGGGLLLLWLVWIGISLALLPPVSTLKEPRTSLTIRVRDWKGNEHPFVVGPQNRYWTPLARIPAEMKWGVILAEDSNFYRHEGVDVTALKKALSYDLEKKRLARGASTITQQTAKNLFLSREKTITRKLKELYLAVRMEQELTKGRILELYLNLVELGPMVYGVGHGSRYYFGKPPALLTPREASFLAAMLPGPRVAYNPYRNLGKVLKRSDMILGLMRKKGVLSEEEYQAALREIPNIAGMQRKVERAIQQPPILEQASSAHPPPPVEQNEAPRDRSDADREPPPSGSGGERREEPGAAAK